MPMLLHPCGLAEQRALLKAPRRLSQPKEARRLRCEGKGAELQREPLRVLLLVEVPLCDGVRIRRPRAEAERRRRWEVLAGAAGGHGLNVGAIRVHPHDTCSILVLTVENKDQLLRPLVCLLVEALDDILDLALRAMAGWNNGPQSSPSHAPARAIAPRQTPTRRPWTTASSPGPAIQGRASRHFRPSPSRGLPGRPHRSAPATPAPTPCAPPPTSPTSHPRLPPAPSLLE
mmetsp:Transcript_114560/g.330968  ORF Transcript_114560/g.330968 Transcript_114560/m.330968 type:complete len:231 (+) Transcript_114560:491-1183(+)